MRRLVSVASLLAVFLISAIPTATVAQDHSAQVQVLDWLVGSWTFDHLDGGGECEKLGDYISFCRMHWGDAEGVFVTRYDTVAEVWKGYRFYKGGNAEEALGWIAGNTRTFVYEGRNGTRNKSVAVAAGDNWTYTWYRSEQGGPWEQTSEGSMTRVR